MLSWPKGLTSKERKASTQRQNNDFIELEVTTAAVPFGLFMSLNQQEKEEVIYGVGWCD